MYTAQQYKKGQPRWCPGCGDHFFLASLHKAMAEIGVAPKDIAVISGIGCSSRLPHYMATYGMNTIHGRAAAIATGAKVANPALTVWQVSGDGDGLAIGGTPASRAPWPSPTWRRAWICSAQQPHLRAHQGPVQSHVAPWLREQVVALRHGGGPLPPR